MANCEKLNSDAYEGSDGIVSPDRMQVVQFAPPAGLAPFVTQIYFFNCEEPYICDLQPASLGHLIFLLKGKGTLQFSDGHVDVLPTTAVFGPGLAAARFTFEGPLHDLGFALSPLGFVALTGKAANQYADRAVPSAELFGPEIDTLADQFCRGHSDGSMRLAQMVDAVSDFLLARVRAVPPSHMRMVQVVIDWLSSDLDPDVDLLYPQLDMSRSTAARLITRYFGFGPKAADAQISRTARGQPAGRPRLHARITRQGRVAFLRSAAHDSRDSAICRPDTGSP